MYTAMTMITISVMNITAIPKSFQVLICSSALLTCLPLPIFKDLMIHFISLYISFHFQGYHINGITVWIYFYFIWFLLLTIYFLSYTMPQHLSIANSFLQLSSVSLHAYTIIHPIICWQRFGLFLIWGCYK